MRVVFVGLGALVLVAGCSSDASTNDPSPTPQPVAVEDLSDSLAAAVCDKVESCCSADGLPFARSSCLTRSKQGFDAFVEPLRTSGATYDAEKGGACVGELEKKATECQIFSEDLLTACDAAFTGVKQLGEACDRDVECAAPEGMVASCLPPVVEPQGSCIAFQIGKIGDACNLTITPGGFISSAGTGPAVCRTDDNLFCKDSGQCAELLAGGATCEADQLCASGVCNGVCESIKSLGAACNGIVGNDCEAGAYCTGGLCAAAKADGEDCQEGYECKSGTCSGKCGANNVSTNFCEQTGAPT